MVDLVLKLWVILFFLNFKIGVYRFFFFSDKVIVVYWSDDYDKNVY